MKMYSVEELESEGVALLKYVVPVNSGARKNCLWLRIRPGIVGISRDCSIAHEKKPSIRIQPKIHESENPW